MKKLNKCPLVINKLKINRRIAFFLPSLVGGGAERIMLTLAEAFVTKGYRVDLVVTSARGSLAGSVPNTVRLVDLNASRIVASLPVLVRYLRYERPDAMLSALSSTNCIAVWARKLSRHNTKLVLSEHNTLSQNVGNTNLLKLRMLPWIMRQSYPEADEIVAVSRGVAKDLSQKIGLPYKRIQVIYNPVLTPKFLELSREPVDHPWFTADQPPVILGAGRLIPQKDFSTLIKGFAKIHQQINARLVILGEGPDRAKLEALANKLCIKEDVDLPGFVSNPYSFMRKAKVFVLSSRWEGFGNVLVEAMAAGTCVVSTDCPNGPSEILENGAWGELVPVGQCQELADAIKNALIHCREVPFKSVKRFDANSIFKQYEEIVTS